MTLQDFLAALGSGSLTGCVLAVQVAVLRRMNRKYRASHTMRLLNYVLGDGTLLIGFAGWGWMTGQLAAVAAYILILCAGGAGTIGMYTILGIQDQRIRAARPARQARRQAQEEAAVRATLEGEAPRG